MAQVIRAVLKDPKDYTELRLLYANSSPGDVLLKQELEEFAREHDNFKVWFTGAVSGFSRGLTLHVPASVVCGSYSQGERSRVAWHLGPH